MKLSRRKTILGMGLLAGGSGAAFSSAAFNNSVDSTGNMQVIAASDLNVRKGSNVPTSDSVNTVNSVDFLNLDQTTDSRISSGTLDFSALTGSDVPVAGVDDSEDANLVINTATGIRPTGGSAVIFEKIIEIANDGDTTVTDIGISYGATGAYGADVDGTTITEDIIKDIYQFYVQPTGVSDVGTEQRISPDPATTPDDPDTVFKLEPGETAQIDLDNNNQKYRSELQSASSTSGDPWAGVFDPLDLLSIITVGSGYTAPA